MKSRLIGFRSLAAMISFLLALGTTVAGTYAVGIDGARHYWVSIASSLWITFLIFLMRDQFLARQERIDDRAARIQARMEILLDESAKIHRLLADMSDRWAALPDAVKEYGDQRQISGHLSSLRQSTGHETSRLVAGATSNVRVLPGR